MQWTQFHTGKDGNINKDRLAGAVEAADFSCQIAKKLNDTVFITSIGSRHACARREECLLMRAANGSRHFLVVLLQHQRLGLAALASVLRTSKLSMDLAERRYGLAAWER
jgi:hypothetical protein